MNPGFGHRARIPACAFGFAVFAMFWIVPELLLIKERLLGGRKHEISPALYALQHTIFEFQLR
jgi:hypothetical protein